MGPARFFGRTAAVPGASARAAAVVLAAAAALLLGGCRNATTAPGAQAAVRIAGTVWQPDAQTVHPQGIWERLGARTLLVQWTARDGHAFVDGCPAAGAVEPPQPRPDWARIAREPWAQNVILGLAAHGDETAARASVESLVARSRCLAALATPLKVTGWYFPVEVDPTWKDAAGLARQLEGLPRPLWISAYDGANVGPAALADWLHGWLPKDVGVFFQDGVGVHARSAPVARDYLLALRQRLGPRRVRLIAEAFRPAPGGGFRPATPEELVPQLATYGGHEVFLFDGPHYVDTRLVEVLREKLVPAGR
ncbi:hypothetical protein [uncultured Xylophilus sp.]|uniref:hypothetical protein n=1 Tax=uncultured Xylophilus sp. TaxID=296832 RepID=UPI0025EF027D|nr:hypothetical protein [uncultured Xylophilus sp.]